MNRRSLLAVAPMAGVVATMPQVGRARADTRIMQLYRKWEAAYAYACEPCADEEEVARRCDIYGAIEQELLATPAQDARDVFAKLAAGAGMGDWAVPSKGSEGGDLLWAEIEEALQ